MRGQRDNLRLTRDALQVELRSAGDIIRERAQETRAISARAAAAMTAVDDIATAVARSTQEMGKALRDARLNITTAQPPT
jgi:hypothetical protein